jgi:putative transposase
MLKAFKYRIRTSKAIEANLQNTLNVCRELYNAGLQERREAWKRCGASINYAAQCMQLPEIKAIRPDVGSVHSQVLQQTLKRLQRAFDNFFRRVKNGEKPGYPRFKPASRYDSFTYPQGGWKLDGDKLTLSKIGSVRLRLSRPIEGIIKTCTIKRQVDGWFVIFTVEDEPKPLQKTGHAVGIDVGLENFATLSTGEVVDNPHFLRRAEQELKTAQRRVSRRKRGGSNRKKAVKVLAKKHLKIQNQRKDFCHKLSNQLVKEFDVIAVEDLNIQNMVKNHHLAKSIADASWGTFTTILSHKAECAGKSMVKVLAAYTSQDCSRCGHRVRKTLATREHRCINCGLVLHRDLNAAHNILGRADRLLMSEVALANDARIPCL